MHPPTDPIAAVTHPDPYPYYAALAAERPLYRDATLGLWVASGAGVVGEVLASDACRVRPAAEPVPAALLGTAAGDLFARLVRMTDGPAHRPLRRAVAAALHTADGSRAAAIASACARRLADALPPTPDRHALGDFAFRVPVHVVGTLLGIPDGALDETTALVDALVRGLAPAAPAERVARAAHAATRLCDALGTIDGGLSGALRCAAHEHGLLSPDVVVANAVGFLTQSYEATAALIGNTLVALAAQPGAYDAGAVPALVRDVARRDPAVHNTRRWAARDVAIGGRPMHAGDAILVVLAAAGQGFGAGAHACPGEALASTIASAGVAELVARGVPLGVFVRPVAYRGMPNVRIPFEGTITGRELLTEGTL